MADHHQAIIVRQVRNLLGQGGIDRQIRCRLTVRRVEELEPDRHYSIGADIAQIEPRDRRTLQRFIRNLADLNLESRGVPEKVRA